MGTLIYGFGRYFLFDLDVIYMPETARHLLWLGQGTLLGVPVPIFLFARRLPRRLLFLRYTKSGRYLRAVGDNLLAARITGVPARPIIVLQYVLSSLVGFVAGIVTAASVASMNTRVANLDLCLRRDPGRGARRHRPFRRARAASATSSSARLLIGVLLNGMTIMDIQYTVQNVIKGVILLTAIVIDTILNPRDEQTAQQGDI